jgi:ribosomal protein S18 acetylase RimI-like enzyme
MIRQAEEKDIPGIRELLRQVLNLHAQGRPDLFIPERTKYTDDELKAMLKDPTLPIFVYIDEKGQMLGYAFCQLQHRLHANNMTDITTLFVDDICVDEKARGRDIGKALYEHVRSYAREKGCYHITLNVWSFNTHAQGFYEKMGMKPMETVMEEILK